jgi:hypothetical protein
MAQTLYEFCVTYTINLSFLFSKEDSKEKCVKHKTLTHSEDLKEITSLKIRVFVRPMTSPKVGLRRFYSSVLAHHPGKLLKIPLKEK